jgi:cytochrome c oxidase subunit 2
MIASVTTTAWIITVAYCIVVAIGSVIALAIWASTRRAAAAAGDVSRYSEREGLWLLVVLGALFALLMATIFYVPYSESAGPRKQVVRVTGVQFAWAIEPGEVRAGVPVEFLARSGDVTHGFGVYDASGALQFQAQVIPGETQKVVHTFDRPGTYDVLCLEFCGRDHHLMEAVLQVRE